MQDKNKNTLFSELSVVLAGSKTAALILSLVSIGAVSKWIVQHFYPATHVIWDVFTTLTNIPQFSVYLKDSLTAALFFMPLFIKTFLSRRIQSGLSSDTSKVVALLFALFILLLMTKDGLYKIFMHAMQTSSFVEDSIMTFFGVLAMSMIFTSAVGMVVISGNILCHIFRYLLTKELRFPEDSMFRKLNLFALYVSLYAVGMFITFSVNELYLEVSNSKAAGLVFIYTFNALVYSALKAPSIMFRWCGSVIAFLLITVAFEGVLIAKEFIEKVSV